MVYLSTEFGNLYCIIIIIIIFCYIKSLAVERSFDFYSCVSFPKVLNILFFLVTVKKKTIFVSSILYVKYYVLATVIPRRENLNVINVTQFEKDVILVCYDSECITNMFKVSHKYTVVFYKCFLCLQT